MLEQLNCSDRSTTMAGMSTKPHDYKLSAHPGRRRSSGKDILLNLIAREMNSGWAEDDEIDILDSVQPSKYPAELSPEDIFYAQMNGEAIESPAQSIVESKHACDTDLVEEEFNSSFTDLYLQDEILDASLRTGEGSGSLFSAAGQKTQNTRQTSVTTEASSSSTAEESISIDEIQNYIMESLPTEVKNKIPEEAWTQIFRKSNNSVARNKPSRIHLDIQENVNLGSSSEHFLGEASVLSDITGFSSRLPSSVGLSRQAPEEDSSRTKSVAFSFVEVRRYERILEINPAVTNGPAIGIGWRHKRGRKYAIDDWEAQREGYLRQGFELVLPRPIRESILRGAGYSDVQIAEAVRVIRKTKDRRKLTVQNLCMGTEEIEETIESASRRIKGLLGFGRRKGLLK